MELSKKTTILFPPDLHAQLTRLARQRDSSLGELVRKACEVHYQVAPAGSRLDAVEELAALALPVADVRQMKAESVPPPREMPP